MKVILKINDSYKYLNEHDSCKVACGELITTYGGYSYDKAVLNERAFFSPFIHFILYEITELKDSLIYFIFISVY